MAKLERISRKIKKTDLIRFGGFFISRVALLIFYPLSRIMTNLAIFLKFSWEPIGMTATTFLSYGRSGVPNWSEQNEEILQYLLMR